MDIPAALSPFAVSFTLLFLIAAMQVLGIGDLFGDADADADLDVDGGHDSPGALAGLASLVGVGRLPFLMWLSLFLFLYSATGVVGQSLIEGATGAMLPAALGGALALLPALVLAGAGSALLERILPQDETSAVSRATLVGKRGHIDIGTARRGNPARARVLDTFGQAHNVMVEPHEDGAAYAAGEEVLLVRREGELFFAIADSDRRLGTVG